MGDSADNEIAWRMLEGEESQGEKELREKEEVGLKHSLVEGDLDPVVNEIFSLVPPIDLKDWRIRGLVERAVCAGSIQGLFLLKLKGVNFRELRLPSGDSLMHRASVSRHVDTMWFLFREGLCVDDRCQLWNLTPLHVAASNDRVDMVRLLLLLGATIDAQDYRGRTPLHHAVASNSYRAAVILVLAGASLTRKDEMGHTPATMPQSSRCLSFNQCLQQAFIHASRCWHCSQVTEDNVIS